MNAPTDWGPLADLHRHLDGSLRTETLSELASPLGLALPDEIGFAPGMGLSAALACFDLTLAVLQSPKAVERVADEICSDAQEEGVATLEIRFAPQLHREAAIADVVDAATCGAAGRAGLILCGLYGDPPDLLDRFLDLATTREAVVGIDLAGGPDSGQRWQMVDYAPAFQRARSLGVGRTVHAGEGRPASEIREAIELLDAQRIGHGTSLLEEPSLVDLVLERGVHLEACLTSNFHTGAIPAIDAHPIARWLDLGLSVSINTDNTLFSRTDARREHAVAADTSGMSAERVERAIAHGHAAAFRRG